MTFRFQATDSMKMSMTQATFQRNAAMQEMQRVRKDLSLSESEHEQVNDPPCVIITRVVIEVAPSTQACNPLRNGLIL